MPPPPRTPWAQPVTAGVVTAVIGFTSSFAVVLAGLRAAGATERQAASGLLTLSVLMGITGCWLSVRTRLPISIAWSTPGAALLASSGRLDGGFPIAVGSFLVCGALIVLSGSWPRLTRAVAAIPAALASALLAGVLLGLVLQPVRELARDPRLAVPVVLTWLVLLRPARRWAVPAALAVALVAIALSGRGGSGGLTLAPQLTLVRPAFSPAGLTLGLSLFVVTMAAQNVPGVAVLATFGYEAPLARALTTTGAATLVGAVAGGHALNLAAISAALCAGPDAGPDRSRRWIASTTAAICYVVFGLGAGVVTALASPAPGLIEAVAGLALLGTLAGSLTAALAEPTDREAAMVTFVVTASAVTIGGIGSACWGLVAGAAVMIVLRPGRAPSS